MNQGYLETKVVRRETPRVGTQTGPTSASSLASRPLTPRTKQKEQGPSSISLQTSLA